jgi:23S rRNA pseudouridine1911/1915/1917 synthase
MVVAKTEEVLHLLKDQFRNHTTTKVYLALVEGIVEKDAFTIDAPLGRGKKEYKQSTNPENPRGPLRSAVTDVLVLKRGNDRTMVKLSPKTGRTHQLRAHMSSIGHPIVGDKAYGSVQESERIMLHAKSLGFLFDGKECFFEVEEGGEFV